ATPASPRKSSTSRAGFLSTSRTARAWLRTFGSSRSTHRFDNRWEGGVGNVLATFLAGQRKKNAFVQSRVATNSTENSDERYCHTRRQLGEALRTRRTR